MDNRWNQKELDRSLELLPHVWGKALELAAACSRAGYFIRLGETYRSPADQAARYAQGRTAPGHIVTHARPGWSWHQWRRAFDIFFDGPEPYGEKQPWYEVGKIGESLGFEWGGRWLHADRPHFQMPGRIDLSTRIDAEDVAFSTGEIGATVKRLQSHLRDAGFDPGALDGRFGKRTRAAVLAFQDAAGIPVTGTFGAADIEPLETLLAQKAEGTPKP